MYQISLTKEAAKETKKRGRLFHQKITNILMVLKTNPYPHQSERFSGKLNFIHSYHFNFTGSSFRLCYKVNESDHNIIILMIGPRENFYNKLMQKLS